MFDGLRSLSPSRSGSLQARLGVGRAGLLAMLALFVVYVANGWTPSHYGEAARMLGIADAGPVLGTSRPIRSDEWAVATPYFQIAVASGLGARDEVSPFKEPLKAFFALPSRDWSMVFKPDLWGFLVLDPAHAFSLHYALLAAGMLVGFAVLLRQLGCTPGFALVASALLFLSQFVQVWWSSDAPVFAFAPWPVVAFLWRGPWWARLPAIAYAVAAWLIGELYPPFIVAAGLAFGILVVAFRPDALRPARLLTGVLAAGLGVAVAWIHFADLVAIMSATAYPGRRLADGGGVHLLQILAHLAPNLVTGHYEPLGLWPSNACEIGVVGSLLPLAGLVFCDHRALAAWVRAHPWAVTVWTLGLLLILAWMTLPIPAHLAPGLNLSPPARMLWGFGLAWLLGLAVMLSAVPWILTPLRLAIFMAAVLGAWAWSKLLLTDSPIPAGRFDLAVVFVLVPLLLIRTWRPDWLPARRLILLTTVLTAAITFGRFNPVQPAKPIFAHRTSPVLETFKAYAQANPRGWVVAPGMYGSVINGAGVPAINHTLLRPQLTTFRGFYPQLGAPAFNDAFNRYEHLQPGMETTPTVVQPDLVALPLDPFAIPLPVALGAARPAGAAPAGPNAPAGHVDQVQATRIDRLHWQVTVMGWSPWSGVTAGQSLQAAISPAVGKLVGGHAFRLPRPDVMTMLHDPKGFADGFGARLEVETAQPIAQWPADALSFGAADPVTGEHPIPVGP